MNAQDSPEVRDTGLRSAVLTLTAIVCAYNEEKTLPAALHSLFAQTRVPDEVIVVNNASTDRTRAVVERIPGIVVVDEPDKGLVRARARGMQAAKHLFSWKTLVRSRKDWPALKTALTDNMNVAITLYRGESWTASRGRYRQPEPLTS